MNATERTPQARAQGGPSLTALAIVFVVLFLASIAISAIMAGGDTFASPFGSATDIQKYFHDHQDAVRISAFLQFGAAIPLVIYSATVSTRLRILGIRAPGATIALVGGVMSATFLAMSALVSWVLSRPEVLAEPTLVRALQDLTFITGGPGHVVPLGLLVAGIAVPGGLARLMPRWLAVVGLVIAAIAELSALTVAASDVAILLPIARFPALIWLIAVAIVLPHVRTNNAATGT